MFLKGRFEPQHTLHVHILAVPSGFVWIFEREILDFTSFALVLELLASYSSRSVSQFGESFGLFQYLGHSINFSEGVSALWFKQSG